MTMRTDPLFPAPPTPELKFSASLEVHRGWVGTYAKYAPVKRVACDECVTVLHEAKGVGEPPRAARVTRRSGGGLLRLCQGHGELWRKFDGVGEKRGKK